MASANSPAALRWQPPASLPLLGLIAVGCAVAWTLIGCLIAISGNSLHLFWREWISIQGFFDVLAGVFLGLLATSPTLHQILRDISDSKAAVGFSDRPRNKWCQRIVVTLVTVAGTVTTTRLGFAVPPPTRYFMWATCVGACFLAGLTTWHAVEVFRTAMQLDKLKIKFFVYSPGETRSLKRLALYFVIFGLALTFGYTLSFIGTMSSMWTGNPIWVNAVRVFWPTIYVPLCLVVTAYPHMALHRLIRREKDRLIIAYQEQINSMIGDGEALSKDVIERVNALADLIRRIESSPSFAVTFPIALGTAITYIVNIASLFIPKELTAQILHKALSFQ